jgi:hypothetical protein
LFKYRFPPQTRELLKNVSNDDEKSPEIPFKLPPLPFRFILFRQVNVAIPVVNIWSCILVTLLLFDSSAAPKAEETPSARAHLTCKSRLFPSNWCAYPDSNLVKSQQGDCRLCLLGSVCSRYWTEEMHGVWLKWTS